MIPWERKSYSMFYTLCAYIVFFGVSLCIHTLSHLYFWFHFHKMHSALICTHSHIHTRCVRFSSSVWRWLVTAAKYMKYVCYDRFFWQILFFMFVVFDRFYLSFSFSTTQILFFYQSLTSSLQFSLSHSLTHSVILFHSLFHPCVWWVFVFTETRQILLLLQRKT